MDASGYESVMVTRYQTQRSAVLPKESAANDAQGSSGK